MIHLNYGKQYFINIKVLHIQKKIYMFFSYYVFRTKKKAEIIIKFSNRSDLVAFLYKFLSGNSSRVC